MFDWEGWYRRARPLLHPLRIEQPAALSALEASLEEALQKAAPCNLGEGRFAVPPTFAALVDRLPTTGWYSQRIEWDFHLFGAESLVSEVTYGPGDYPPEHVRSVGPWIAIGRERSHLRFFLCCDRDSPKFGRVAVGEDCHPWVPGGYYPSELSLEDWLATHFVHACDRGWILLPLTPEERSRIDHVRGWDLLVAARDISGPHDPSNAVWGCGPKPSREGAAWFNRGEAAPVAARASRCLYEDDSAFVGLIDGGAGTVVVGDKLPPEV